MQACLRSTAGLWRKSRSFARGNVTPLTPPGCDGRTSGQNKPCEPGLMPPPTSGGGRCVFVQTVEGASQKHCLCLCPGELA